MDTQQLKIPKERIAVLIGKKGETKRELERLSKSKIKVSSDDGDVTFQGEDSLLIYILKDVIKAIGRGFSPENAKLLFNEQNTLICFDLTDYTNKSPKKLQRIKSRIIGKEGKARKTIELLTNSHLSIYGKTVCLIGRIGKAEIVAKAIEDLILGAPHGPVFKKLEESIKGTKRRNSEVGE